MCSTLQCCLLTQNCIVESLVTVASSLPGLESRVGNTVQNCPWLTEMSNGLESYLTQQIHLGHTDLSSEIDDLSAVSDSLIKFSHGSIWCMPNLNLVQVNICYFICFVQCHHEYKLWSKLSIDSTWTDTNTCISWSGNLYTVHYYGYFF